MIRDPEAFSGALEALRRHVRERLIPREREVERLDEVPDDLVAEMAAMGLFGYSIPEAYGGAGMTTEELVLAAIELSQASVAFRARVGTNTGIGSEALVADGTPAQTRALPAAAGPRRVDRRLRADRTGGRVRCHGAEDDRQARRRPLHARRNEVLHHQCADRGPVHGDGAHRSERSIGARRSRRSSSSARRPALRPASRIGRWDRRARRCLRSTSMVVASRPMRSSAGSRDRASGPR